MTYTINFKLLRRFTKWINRKKKSNAFDRINEIENRKNGRIQVMSRSRIMNYFLSLWLLFLFPPFYCRRPTFKTATPTSRTQLKQQLQREQLQELERQELERRENERKLSIINNNGHNNAGPSSSLHPNQSQTNLPQFNQHQLSIPRDNYGSNSSLCMTSSPTPSTSTNGSDFSASQYSNQNQQFDHSSQQSSAPLKVPLHIGVDLPPQVLKVCPHNVQNVPPFRFSNSEKRF